MSSHKHHHHSNGASADAGSGLVRPWSPSFNPGNTSFTTLDGRPVDWNSGWAGLAGEAAGTQQAPPPLASKQGSETITYLPYPELTCLHCLGSNPPGKLGYVVSYLPVIPAGSKGVSNPVENQTPVANKVNGHSKADQEGSETSHDEGGDAHIELPVRSRAPSQSSLLAARTGREAFRSDQRERRARSRAEERAQDIARGRQIEREEQAERARSSSVSWELAGVGKQYVPDGEEEDNVIE
ncbi:hypothetical protein I316_04309 [Kwoniella heveanensis BCC8398]|uniref:Uncharacterized protein n=1 Tax=Kwoniella heveanensis BCC8398 TaxID=1296120 RepID=A0A1B9GSF8_9TREE|nr:hypothetical protein I316_04309 [Kwoniella heveanensis BCC8398]